MMEFWATWCPNCKELEPTLLAAAKKYGAQVKFVGVAVSVNESPDEVKAFVAKHGLPGDQYFDTKGEATGAYDVPATSYVVVINKAGKVVVHRTRAQSRRRLGDRQGDLDSGDRREVALARGCSTTQRASSAPRLRR